MAYFTVKYIKPATGRINTMRRSAFDRDRLLRALSDEGIAVQEVIEDPPSPASERQTDYLRDLGGTVFPGMSTDEAHDLIDNAIERKTPSDQSGVEVARHFNIPITRYTSKGAIYARALQAAEAAGDQVLARWFAYRVYRVEFDRSLPGVTSPDHAAIRLIADEIVADDKQLSSLKRAARASTTGFRWFGQFTGKDGATHTGDSKRTSVYVFVVKRLVEMGMISGNKGETTRGMIGSERDAPAILGKATQATVSTRRQARKSSRGWARLFKTVAIIIFGLIALAAILG